MLIRARASFSATRATVPGLLRSLTTKAGSSLARSFAARSARLARPGLFTTIRSLPLLLRSPADSAVMLTPASASARATFARTPGLDWSVSVSWVVLGMAAPPPQRFDGSILPRQRDTRNASIPRDLTSKRNDPGSAAFGQLDVAHAGGEVLISSRCGTLSQSRRAPALYYSCGSYHSMAARRRPGGGSRHRPAAPKWCSTYRLSTCRPSRRRDPVAEPALSG